MNPFRGCFKVKNEIILMINLLWSIEHSRKNRKDKPKVNNQYGRVRNGDGKSP